MAGLANSFRQLLQWQTRGIGQLFYGGVGVGQGVQLQGETVLARILVAGQVTARFRLTKIR